MRKRINQLKTQINENAEPFFFIVTMFSLELAVKHQLDFDVRIWTSTNLIKALLMMNTNVSTIDFVNFKYVHKHKIFTMFMIKHVNLKLIDDFIEHALTRMIIIKVRLKNHVNEMLCFVTSLNKFDLILKMSWMKEHDVSINKNNKFLTFRSNICLHRCLFSNRSSKMLNKIRSRSRSKFKSHERTFFDYEKNNECVVVSTKIFLMMIERKNHDVVIL